MEELHAYLVMSFALGLGGLLGYVVGSIHQVMTDRPHKFWYAAYEEVAAENKQLRQKLRQEMAKHYDGYRAPPIGDDP